MKLNDIYRWRYTESCLKKLNHGSNGGTTYWCCSQIVVCKETEAGLRLYDTYWSHDPKIIDPTGKNIALEYIGNFDELEKFTGDINHYNPNDLVDLNHPNSSRGNLYIKKGAKKCLETIRAHIQRKIEEKEYEAKSAAQDVIRYKKALDELTENNLDKVWI